MSPSFFFRCIVLRPLATPLIGHHFYAGSCLVITRRCHTIICVGHKAAQKDLFKSDVFFPIFFSAVINAILVWAYSWVVFFLAMSITGTQAKRLEIEIAQCRLEIDILKQCPYIYQAFPEIWAGHHTRLEHLEQELLIYKVQSAVRVLMLPKRTPFPPKFIP